MVVRDAGLVRGGEGDAPGAGFKLHLKEVRRHGGLAVRCELHSVGFDELPHPVEIVLEFVLVEDRDRQAQVFVKEIPAESGDLAGSGSGGRGGRCLCSREKLRESGVSGFCKVVSEG